MNSRQLSFIARIANKPTSSPTTPVVSSVERDSEWSEVRPAARATGINTCWSLLARGKEGLPLGLLLIFSESDAAPSEHEQAVIAIGQQLITIAIEHHQTTRQLAHLVRHDALTGLPNRVLFEDRLHQAVALARRRKKPLALIAMDLNRFKQINDTMGHQAGDALLQQFATRLQAQLRESDTFARVGGDEFMLILPEAGSRADADTVVERLKTALGSTPFELGGKSFAVSSSMGVAMFPDDADDTIPLQHAADAAMYRAKKGFSRACA